MATYPRSGSTLNGSINTGLSSQIVVKVENTIVGAIQSLSINQSRNLERIKELGLDGILEIVPRQATEYDASIKRIVFDKKRLPEAFGRGFINIKSQIIPFNIVIIDNTSGENNIFHTLENCWFSRYSPTYQAENFIISEDATIFFEDISSTFGNSEAGAANNPIYSVGNDNIKPLEREIDAGKKRGGMDTVDIFGITNTAFSG